LKTPQGQVEKQKFLKDTNPALHKYINHWLAGDNKGIDTIYGPKYNMNAGNWTMGSKITTFGVDDIYVGNKSYKGTQGLYELLFASKPEEAYITENDREAYKSILQRTNTHRRNFTSHSRLYYTKTMKYNGIIRPLFNKTGRGMDARAVLHEYWDDPNKLVDRLRLLLASDAAGNNAIQMKFNPLSKNCKRPV
jgi:hypothetical protein